MAPPKFQTISFPGESTKYIFVTDAALKQLTAMLAHKILKGEENIDYLIALAKGGWTVARTLFGYLSLPPLNLHHSATIGVKSYEGINQMGKARINQKLSQEQEKEVQGKTVLVVDDLTDTGEQLNLVKKYLEKLKVKKVVMATMFRKPPTQANIHYWAEETRHWIIFAYEALETMPLLEKIWAKKSLSDEQIYRRFAKIGFSVADIEYYWAHRQPGKRVQKTRRGA